MALLSSLLLSLTHLPPSLFLPCFSFCCVPLSASLWASLQFTWWADGQQTNIGPGSRQAERTRSSRAEQRGCYITFRMIPLQRLLTVPHQQQRFSERDDSCFKMSGWGKRRAAGWCSKQRTCRQPEAMFTWTQPVLIVNDNVGLFSSWDMMWPLTCALV